MREEFAEMNLNMNQRIDSIDSEFDDLRTELLKTIVSKKEDVEKEVYININHNEEDILISEISVIEDTKSYVEGSRDEEVVFMV